MHVFEMQARVDEASIRQLVHRFYDAVREDAVLNTVFAARIADDAWPVHLERMCAFWSTALLATGTYRGNPMTVHESIPQIEPEHFARWLGLFETTARDVFDEDVAQAIVARAHRMGSRLRDGVTAARSRDR